MTKNLPTENLPDEFPPRPHCDRPGHEDTALVCPRCNAAKGGQSRSKKKLAAVRRNAKLGGRPSKRKLARRKLAAEKLAG